MVDTVGMANGALLVGKIYDLSSARANKLIDKKLAKPITDEKERTPVKRRVTSLPHGNRG